MGNNEPTYEEMQEEEDAHTFNGPQPTLEENREAYEAMMNDDLSVEQQLQEKYPDYYAWHDAQQNTGSSLDDDDDFNLDEPTLDEPSIF